MQDNIAPHCLELWGALQINEGQYGSLSRGPYCGDVLLTSGETIYITSYRVEVIAETNKASQTKKSYTDR